MNKAKRGNDINYMFLLLPNMFEKDIWQSVCN